MTEKTRLPWFPFFPEKWLSSDDVALMSIAEEGAYHRLLCREWMEPDCGLPDDDSKLAVLSKMGSAWRKSASKIREKFVSRDGRIFNEKLVEIWEQQKEKSAKARANAHRSHSGRSAASAQRTQSGGSARASVSVSSFSSSEVKAEEQQTALVQSEYPKTLATIREFDPSVDETFVRGLANRVAHTILSDPKFPPARAEKAMNDGVLAKACRRSFTTGPPTHRAGLLLARVPNIIVTWGIEGANER